MSLSRTPSGHLQCNSRCGILHSTIFIGMGDHHRGCGFYLHPTGQWRGRSLCNKIESQTTSVCKLATRSFCDSFSDELYWHKGLCFSPVCTDWEMSTEGDTGQKPHDSDSSSLAIATMVPITAGSSGAPPILLPEREDLLIGPFGELHPMCVQKTLWLAA